MFTNRCCILAQSMSDSSASLCIVGPCCLHPVMYAIFSTSTIIKQIYLFILGFPARGQLSSRVVWYMQAPSAAQKQQSATVIQTCWRGSRQRQRFSSYRRSVVLLQALWRRHSAMSESRRLRYAAVTIQSNWRALQAGRDARQLLQHRRSAVCIIQAHWRGHSQRLVFTRQKLAAVVLQTAWRTRVARARSVTINDACQRIQSAWRAYQAGQAARAQLCELHLPAAKVPAHWHFGKQHQHVWSVLLKVVRLQAAVRCFLMRRHFRQTRRSCLVIQSAWRASAAARATRLHLQAQHCAAAHIQARWRGLRQRRQYQSCMFDVQSPAVDCDWHSADDSEFDSADESVNDSADESADESVDDSGYESLDDSGNDSDCDSWSAVSVSPRRPKASPYSASACI